jgi:hypothetical protein
MPFCQYQTTPPGDLLVRAAVLFAICLAAGYSLLPSGARSVRRSNAEAAVAHNDASATPSRQDAEVRAAALRTEIQSLLAQGGCPGWIALASDPGLLPADRIIATSYTPPDDSLGGTSDSQGRWRETARGQFEQPVRLVRLPAPSPDDLISSEEDLLFDSPEVAGDDASKPPAPEGEFAQPAQPSDSPEFTPQELLAQDALEPANAPPSMTESSSAAAGVSTPAPPSAPAAAPDNDLLDGARDLLLDDASADQSPAPPPTAVPQHAIPPASQQLLHDENDLLTPAPPAASRPAPAAPLVGSPVQPGENPQLAPPPATIDSSPFAPPPVGLPAMHGPKPLDATAAGAPGAAAAKPMDEQTRCNFVADSLYPSAAACRTCHEKIYEEWSISSHAYAAVSPMFHKFEQKINDLSLGTIGYFCFRCHSPAGTALGVSRAAALWDMPKVAQEGVTCVACHRIREMYGKTNGERRIETGDIYAPVYGSIGGDGVAAVIAQKDQYKVKLSPDEKGPGQPIHAAGFSFPQLSRSEFCTSCHQVAVYPGIKLEVVWEQYRASPACKKGISCQDCHMGRIPGIPSGYEFGSAAEINKKSVNAHRKHANHVFYGPGYSIAHPGVFPHNPKADRWNVREWLLFDWRAGWGTDAFEDAVDDGRIHVAFPPEWKEADDRYDAREIIEANLKKKILKDQLRVQVMENGSHVDGPFFDGPRQRGVDLKFYYDVANTNEGHNLPTASLGAQPQLWANVVLVGPRGNRLWESGYLDKNGDLADIHSEEVRHKRIAYDWQLFNLQTMFLITGAKGTDREFFLPINVDIDQLPFIRPAAQPVSVINHPPFIRMEARSLAPLGSRRVPYRVPGELLAEPGRYRLSFRMRNRTEPPYFMRFCDSTTEMVRAMIEGTLSFHESSAEFDVH